jgi:APA family basic amino acid/polyamine antiporter
MFISSIFKDKKIQALLNGLIILGYTSLLCVYSLSAGSYLSSFLDKPELKKMIASVVIACCLLLSYMPTALFNSLQTFFVSTKLIVLLFVAIYGLFLKSNNTADNTKNSGIIKALLASLSVFVSFEGFEMNSRYSDNMKNVNKNLPNSYFLTIIVSALVYMGLSITINKHMGGTITANNSAASLIDLVKIFGFTSIGPIVIVITNMLANVSANIATISSNDPMIDGYMKDFGMEKINKKISLFGNSKSIMLWVTCILAICSILFGPEIIVKNSGSFSFLIIFTIVCVMTFITIRKKEKKKEDIKIYNTKFNPLLCKIISILGAVLCASGSGVLVYDIIKELFPNKN